MLLTIKKSTWEIEAQIEIHPKRPILKQLEEAWIEMHSACHAGICGACICNIESWHEKIDKTFLTEPGFPLAEDEVMTCIWGITEENGEIVLKKIY